MRKLSEVLADSANRMNSLEAKMETIWNESGFGDLLNDLSDYGFQITEDKKIDPLKKTYARHIKVQKGHGTYFNVSVNMDPNEKFTYQAAFQTDIGSFHIPEPKPESYNSLADIQVYIGQWLLENGKKFQEYDQSAAIYKRKEEERKRPYLDNFLSLFRPY